MYECVSGFKALEYYGAILADEMGLGKTFQTICLIWYVIIINLTSLLLITFFKFILTRMLLKYGPYGGLPLVKRVLVVAPSSLVGNWENEFIRWLGRDKLRLFCIDQVSFFFNV